MIEELKALAEAQEVALANLKAQVPGSLQEAMDARRAFADFLKANLPAILSALEAVPVMKEAISDACDLMQTAKGLADGPDGGSVTDHLDLAEHRLGQALAALEGK